MDVEKAFDNVDTEVLLDKLDNTGIDTCYVDWIYNFLTNRKYIIKTGDVITETETSDALPQGST